MNPDAIFPEEGFAECQSREIRRITWIGLWINLFLSALKFTAGVFGHSSVLIADAVHSLSDLLTDFAVILGSKYWSRPPDRDHPYGHAKIETLITLLIGSALILVAFGLLVEAVQSLFSLLQQGAPTSPTSLALVAALISVAVKEFLFRITVRVGMRIKSSAVIANAWHHRSDALSSIPAAVAVGTCLLLGDRYAFLDPVGTVVVALMIVYAAWQIIRPTFAALLDAGASAAHCDRIAELIESVPGIRSLHKLQTRFVGPTGISVALHVQVDPDMSVTDAHTLTHEIKAKLLREDPDVIDVFVHVEPTGPEGETIFLQLNPKKEKQEP